MLKSRARRVVDVGPGAIAALATVRVFWTGRTSLHADAGGRATHIAGQCLKLPPPLAVRARKLRIDAMDRSPMQGMIEAGANVADRSPAGAGSFVQDARHSEIAARAGDRDIAGGTRFIGDHRRDQRIVLQRRQYAVAHRAGLADHLGGAE